MLLAGDAEAQVRLAVEEGGSVLVVASCSP